MIYNIFMLGCGHTTNPRNHNPKQTPSAPAAPPGMLSCLQAGTCRLNLGIRDCNSSAEMSPWRWHEDGCQLEGGCNEAKFIVAVTQVHHGQGDVLAVWSSHSLLAAAAWKEQRDAAAETAPASPTAQEKMSVGSCMAGSGR